ncbi:MAG TPA: protease inhibitor I42 family protein [Casimicrobiaceae bacterium]|nr:protease inhibitor I42 family protein [Casimicrobiaceae bacterium]
MRRVVIPAFAVLVAGCAQWNAKWDEMRANPREYFNLLPPVVVTDARVDGQSVAVNRGQALVVRLPEDSAGGERWRLQPMPSTTLIAPVQHDFVARGGADPAASTPGEAVFRLRGIAPGTQQVVLELTRPPETTASRTMRFDVVVR